MEITKQNNQHHYSCRGAAIHNTIVVAVPWVSTHIIPLYQVQHSRSTDLRSRYQRLFAADSIFSVTKIGSAIDGAGTKTETWLSQLGSMPTPWPLFLWLLLRALLYDSKACTQSAPAVQKWIVVCPMCEEFCKFHAGTTTVAELLFGSKLFSPRTERPKHRGSTVRTRTQYILRTRTHYICNQISAWQVYYRGEHKFVHCYNSINSNCPALRHYHNTPVK